MARGQMHKDSKKRRYHALFEMARLRLESGEVAFIQLEQDMPLEAFKDQHTMRVYWAQWKKAQQFLAPDGARWLDKVVLTFRKVQGHYAMQFASREALDRVMLGELDRPHATLMLTGQGSSFQRNTPPPIPRGMEEKAAQMNAEADAANAAREPWVEWAVKEAPQDAFKHLEAFSMPFDSPEGQAYRAKYGE